MLLGWTFTRQSWVYKISPEEDFEWRMTLEIPADNMVLAANLIATGEIVLAVYSLDKLFWTIVMDAKGNVRNEVYSPVTADNIYAGVVGASGLMALIGQGNEALAVIKSLCPTGTYQPYAIEACTYCPEGQYQDEIGQYSCKACRAYCLSCTTSTDCLKCREGYFVNRISSTDSECVSQCPTNYIMDETTGYCESNSFTLS